MSFGTQSLCDLMNVTILVEVKETNLTRRTEEGAMKESQTGGVNENHRKVTIRINRRGNLLEETRYGTLGNLKGNKDTVYDDQQLGQHKEAKKE